MNAVQVEQKSYEIPRAKGSPSRIFSPLPMLSDRLAITKRSSVLAF